MKKEGRKKNKKEGKNQKKKKRRKEQRKNGKSRRDESKRREKSRKEVKKTRNAGKKKRGEQTESVEERKCFAGGCYELKSLEWDKRTTLVLSNTRELDRVPSTCCSNHSSLKDK